jgi:hypothetical protein
MHRSLPTGFRLDHPPFAALAGTLLLALQWLSVSPARADAEIWSRTDEFVRLEQQDDSGAPPNDHPVQLEAGEVGTMLSALQVGFEDEEDPVLVFSREEVAVLGKAIAEGLARAEPDQDVTFSTIGSHKTGHLLGRQMVNTGRVFYRDGKLNAVFGEVHGEYRKKNVYGQRTEDFRPRRDASRTTPPDAEWRLEETAGAERYAAGGQERPDWLLLAPDAAPSMTEAPVASKAAVAREEPAPAATPQPALPQARSAEERLAELKKLRDEDLIPEEVYGAKVQEILDTEAAAPSAGVEDRLRALKDLRQKGLIPEETYRSRLQAIVDEL